MALQSQHASNAIERRSTRCQHEDGCAIAPKPCFCQDLGSRAFPHAPVQHRFLVVFRRCRSAAIPSATASTTHRSSRRQRSRVDRNAASSPPTSTLTEVLKRRVTRIQATGFAYAARDRRLSSFLQVRSALRSEPCSIRSRARDAFQRFPVIDLLYPGFGTEHHRRGRYAPRHPRNCGFRRMRSSPWRRTPLRDRRRLMLLLPDWLSDFGSVELVGVDRTGSSGAGLSSHFLAQRIRVTSSRSIARIVNGGGAGASPIRKMPSPPTGPAVG